MPSVISQTICKRKQASEHQTAEAHLTYYYGAIRSLSEPPSSCVSPCASLPDSPIWFEWCTASGSSRRNELHVVDIGPVAIEQRTDNDGRVFVKVDHVHEWIQISNSDITAIPLFEDHSDCSNPQSTLHKRTFLPRARTRGGTSMLQSPCSAPRVPYRLPRHERGGPGTERGVPMEKATKRAHREY